MRSSRPAMEVVCSLETILRIAGRRGKEKKVPAGPKELKADGSSDSNSNLVSPCHCVSMVYPSSTTTISTDRNSQGASAGSDQNSHHHMTSSVEQSGFSGSRSQPRSRQSTLRETPWYRPYRRWRVASFLLLASLDDHSAPSLPPLPTLPCGHSLPLSWLLYCHQRYSP